jgi:hypothetical protein
MAQPLSAEISRRIVIAVDVPSRLDDGSISECCNLMASRLRYRLNQQYQAQAVERVTGRILERREARAARLNG